MQRGFRDRNYGEVPVRVGDEVKVVIEAVGEKGDGVAKKDGFVLFVPGTKTGQHVTIRVTKVLRKVGFAEVVRQEEAPAPSERPRPAAPAPEPVSREPEPEPSEDFGAELDEED